MNGINDPDLDRLNEALEELKDRLYEHDRRVVDRVGLSGKPSPEEKKARSAIVREINRTRKAIYRLTTGNSGKKKQIKITVSGTEHEQLVSEAEAEGLPFNIYVKRKLLE